MHEVDAAMPAGGRRIDGFGFPFAAAGPLRVQEKVFLRSMKPFAQRLAIISGRQF
jgi:hypothetical protein